MGEQARRSLKGDRDREEGEPGDVRGETRCDEQHAAEDEQSALNEVRWPQQVSAHAGDERRDPYGR